MSDLYLLPKALRWATLEAPELAARVRSKTAIELARTCLDVERVVLFGPAGTGKTSLAVALGRAAMAARDVTGMYLPTFDLDAWHRERTDFELDERARQVPVLVLDEFGAEDRKTSRIVALLHERHANGRQTIVASSLVPQQLAESYSDGVARRLFERSVVIRCDRDEQPKRADVARVRMPPPREFVPEPRGPFVDGPREFFAALSGIGRGGAT